MNLYVLRNTYNATTTEGLLILQNRFFCYTLEDVVRPKGAPKIQDQTAIPAGRYSVVVSLSPKFQRETAEILNVPNFTGIRMHSGNTAKDTSGCLIVAHNRINDTTIQGTAEVELTACLKASPGPHWIEIVNTYPYVGVS